MADPIQLSASVDEDFTNSTPGNAMAPCGGASYDLGSLAGDIGSALGKGALFFGAAFVVFLFLPEELLGAAVTLAAWLGYYFVGQLLWSTANLINDQINLNNNKDKMTAEQIAAAQNKIVAEIHEVVQQSVMLATGVVAGRALGGALTALRAARPLVNLRGMVWRAAPPKPLATFRPNFDQHLVGPDGFQKFRLHGTHNLDNATAALDSRGLPYELKPTGTPGIYELDYAYTNGANDLKIDTKTVYDPKVISDSSMIRSAKAAGQDAFERYSVDPTDPDLRQTDSVQNGIKFRSYINFDKITGNPFVGSVHPIK